ncbi:MAG: hypothetical protein M0P16_07810 [Syntrophales bacterium]|jgi:hypothetical protein|nr:hypothetical protein [Syntrophales bacterium]MCK9391048.1 hypothetical protein [Syntrophales bacterium]
MFNDEEEKLARFRDLTEIMRKAPRRETPEGFTERVMERLPEGKGGVRRFSFLRPFWTPAYTRYLTRGFQLPVTKTECAFYFLLTGFFYLVLGSIMMLGLQRLTGLLHPGWLSVQPIFGLLLAVGLMALGVVLYSNGRSAIRVARIGTVLYAVLVILNGCIGALWTHVPVAFFIAAIFSLTGLGMAAFLGIAVDQYAPETISSQEVQA